MDIRYIVMKELTQNITEELNMFTIHDPLSIDWSTYNFSGNEEIYMLGEEDIKRPDLLSYKFYNTVIYQNIIFILNNIGDILNTPSKTQIKIPKIEDLKTFLLKNKIRRSRV